MAVPCVCSYTSILTLHEATEVDMVEVLPCMNSFTRSATAIKALQYIRIYIPLRLSLYCLDIIFLEVYLQYLILLNLILYLTHSKLSFRIGFFRTNDLFLNWPFFKLEEKGECNALKDAADTIVYESFISNSFNNIL